MDGTIWEKRLPGHSAQDGIQRGRVAQRIARPVVEEVESKEPDAGLATEDEEGTIGYASRTEDVTLCDQGSD